MVYIYDRTYEGFLTAIFETFRLKSRVDNIVYEADYQPGLFADPLYVTTDKTKTRRVQQGIEKRYGKEGIRMMYEVFLTEISGVEMLLYQFVRLAVNSQDNILQNYQEPCVLKLHQLSRKMHREVHRMHAFVRFQQTEDNLYAAIIHPDFNVLPLLSSHFQDRYPAFRWLIYDTHRRYGIYHQDHEVRYVTLTVRQHQYLGQHLLTVAEQDYQKLWKTYFSSVDIAERRNLKLHIQHVPKRYWKYLIEKQP